MFAEIIQHFHTANNYDDHHIVIPLTLTDHYINTQGIIILKSIYLVI